MGCLGLPGRTEVAGAYLSRLLSYGTKVRVLVFVVVVLVGTVRKELF